MLNITNKTSGKVQVLPDQQQYAYQNWKSNWSWFTFQYQRNSPLWLFIPLHQAVNCSGRFMALHSTGWTS